MPNYRLRKNEQFWADKIAYEADDVKNRLLRNRMSIEDELYINLNMSVKLGQVLEFFTLGDLADILHLPVPFIESAWFLKRDTQNHDLFNLLSGQERKKMEEQRNEFRLIFKQIAMNVETLIENDA